jgi:hypothetical protein
MREESLGPQHPDVADSLQQLGDVLREQGRYTEAEPLYRRAVAIRRKLPGGEHRHAAPFGLEFCNFQRRIAAVPFWWLAAAISAIPFLVDNGLQVLAIAPEYAIAVAYPMFCIAAPPLCRWVSSVLITRILTFGFFAALPIMIVAATLDSTKGIADTLRALSDSAPSSNTLSFAQALAATLAGLLAATASWRNLRGLAMAVALTTLSVACLILPPEFLVVELALLSLPYLANRVRARQSAHFAKADNGYRPQV